MNHRCRQTPSTITRRSCLKTKIPVGRVYLGTEPGGFFYELSKEASRGMSRKTFIRRQNAIRAREYEDRIIDEECSLKRFMRPRWRHAAPTFSPRPNVTFGRETIRFFNPERAIREAPTTKSSSETRAESGKKDGQCRRHTRRAVSTIASSARTSPVGQWSFYV